MRSQSGLIVGYFSNVCDNLKSFELVYNPNAVTKSQQENISII